MNDYSSPEDLVADASFVRWVQGTATAAEAQRWQQWLAADPARRSLVREAQHLYRILQISPEPAHPETAEEWTRLRRRLSRSRPGARAPRPARRASRVVRRFAPAAVVACIVLVSAALAWWLHDPLALEMRTVQTAYGERATVYLSDSTRVVLNANSRLAYPATLTATHSTVRLQGEAYFDVRPQPAGRAFQVATTAGAVRVLGTQFSIASWGEETRVALNEGRVEVSVTTKGARRAEATLAPGQLARFSAASDTITMLDVNPLVYSSWASPRLVFEDTPVAEIVRRIEYTYGLDVEVRDRDLLARTVSGTVENDVNVLLSGLSNILRRPVYREGDTVIIE